MAKDSICYLCGRNILGGRNIEEDDTDYDICDDCLEAEKDEEHKKK